MKTLAACLTGLLLVSFTAQADAQQRRNRDRDNDGDERYASRVTGRSTTVGPGGVCTRDTGRPLESLNLNHECDRQEFWARQNDKGGSGRN